MNIRLRGTDLSEHIKNIENGICIRCGEPRKIVGWWCTKCVEIIKESHTRRLSQ